MVVCLQIRTQPAKKKQAAKSKKPAEPAHAKAALELTCKAAQQVQHHLDPPLPGPQAAEVDLDELVDNLIGSIVSKHIGPPVPAVHMLTPPVGHPRQRVQPVRSFNAPQEERSLHLAQEQQSAACRVWEPPDNDDLPISPHSSHLSYMEEIV